MTDPAMDDSTVPATGALAEHRIGHYMWDVARVHRDLLRDAAKKK